MSVATLSVEPQLVAALPLDPYAFNAEENQRQETEEKPKDWDVFGLTSDEWAENGSGNIFKALVKLLKLVVYLLTFCLVLGSAVASKGTILLMTSAIRKNSTFAACGKYKEADLERDKYLVVLSDEERRGWIWCLLFALFVPEVLIFISSMRICVFKHVHLPRLSTFFLVLCMETFHSIGLVMLLFVVFPRMHYLEALTVTNAVCFVPSLVNFLSTWNTSCNKKVVKKSVFDLLALLGQTTAICMYLIFAFNNTHSQNTWECVVSLLLVSCAWWENFISDDSVVFRCFLDTKKDLEESRHSVYVFVPVYKILLIFGVCTVCLFFMEEDVKLFLVDFKNSFTNHHATVISPLDLFTTVGKIESDPMLPVVIACVHVASSFLCYSCSKFACKICIQGFSFALPINLTVPATMCLLYVACTERSKSSCTLRDVSPYVFWTCPEENLRTLIYSPGIFMWIVWIISQIWMTSHIWAPKLKRMASTSELFVNPLYCSVLIDQSLAMNRKKDQEMDELYDEIAEEALEMSKKSIPWILACATMWHETPEEMEQLLKSIMRMDNDQCLKRALRQKFKGATNTDYYEMEAHIFFDDAFVVSDEDDSKMVINSFVKDLIVAVDAATSKVYPPDKINREPPIKVPTPYGGRLIWKLQGENILIAHLKNKDLIRHKKRWSQVMYMYYLLGYRLMNPDVDADIRQNLERNTFILALDGDIDFKPDAVQLLVDLMKRNEKLGAACGRIHPVGTGMMVYYQKFEYAIGHWLQKATEHIIGCVLCSPGCFSLFRAEALMQDNVIKKYTTVSREAIQFVQFDQGEDRWLCTLLLQSGSRVEYSAASDAYTHCPESFAEFYTQRRRWAPSTMANIMDLLLNYKKTVRCNDNISLPYIAYQLMLMVGTVLGPGTIFLMLVGAMVSAFQISNWQSFIANMVPIIFFILICFFAKNDTQILVAQILSAAYALLMMAVLVGISLQLVTDGIASPTAIFLLSMTASFVAAAIAHPQEFWCVAHGLIYFISVPSMYLLLTLYSVINLHIVSWGTREVATKKTKKQLEQEKRQAAAAAQKVQKGGMSELFKFFNDKRLVADEEEGSITFGLANLFRCMCCTYPKPDQTKLHLVQIGERLDSINKQIKNLHMLVNASAAKPLRGRSVQNLPNKDLIPEVEVEIDASESDHEEINGAASEHMYNQITVDDNNSCDEYWLKDPLLGKSPIWRLSEKEELFWRELIQTYLQPLPDNPEEKAKVAAQLLDLRNKVVFGMLMLNSLFILIVFLLQMQKEMLHIEWPFNGNATITYISNQVIIEFEYLQLEPINLILVFFFSVIVLIQFVAMLFHRFQTMSHILASTDLNLCGKNSATTDEFMMDELATTVQRLNLRPNPVMEVESAPRRRNTVAHLGLNRAGNSGRQNRSLSVAYEETLQKIVENDPLVIKQVRRFSKNNAMLGALRRYTLSPSATTTPSSSCRSYSRDIARLDQAFSSLTAKSVTNSYLNRGYEDSLDGRESVPNMASRELPTDAFAGERQRL